MPPRRTRLDCPVQRDGEDMTKQINEVGTVILHDGLLLCAQRTLKSSLPGLWESPGGKIEPSETPLEREIRDELIADVQVGDRVETTAHEFPFGEVTLTTFDCDVLSGDVTLTEYDAIVWLPPAELAPLDWAPAGVPTVQALSGLLAEPSDPTSRLTLFGR